MKEKSLATYYDEILLEGLRLAQADAQRGLLDEDRLYRIRDVVAEIVDDLATHADAIDANVDSASPLAQLEKAEAKGEKKSYRSAGATANPFYASRDRASSTRP